VNAVPILNRLGGRYFTFTLVKLGYVASIVPRSARLMVTRGKALTVENVSEIYSVLVLSSTRIINQRSSELRITCDTIR